MSKGRQDDGQWVRITAADTGSSFPDAVRRFRLTLVEGPGAGRSVDPGGDRAAIGAHPSNDLTIDDPTVSRFHCEVRIEQKGPVVRDLDSRNGTLVDGVRVREAFLRHNSLIRIGKAAVELSIGEGVNRIALSQKTQFGSLSGCSAAMRATFALLERAAATNATVLLEGETGTGKGAAAESIHRESGRSKGPFVIVDCSAIPGPLLESELFGHEKGSFTGADARRIGAFEAAHGGTVFLDEIGELGADLQPKLLRVLENRAVRRIGSNTYQPIDVRLLAATNRDLRAEVNAGRFRPDLYFRLAVVRIPMPPLRMRPEDMPDLARSILGSLGASADDVERLCSQELLTRLRHAAWPGNVRELRNYLERCLVFDDAAPLSVLEAPDGNMRVRANVPYAEERRRILDEFEKRYVTELLRLHDGKVQKAASAAGINRVYLFRIARRHGLKRDADG